MISGGDVPFARANENPGLLAARHRKIPPFILKRVGGRYKRHCCGIVFRADALINFFGLGRRGDASIGLRHNFYEAR
jgi:hypothetical protein